MKFAAVGAQVGCLTLLIVFLSVFGGLWLDRVLGSKPAFTVIFLLGSAPLALVLTFWIAKRSVQNLTAPPSDGAKDNSGKEEPTRE